MRRRRKWRWKEVLPYSACMCFGKKERWQAIGEEDEEPGSDSPGRREAISFERGDKNATYVRMLGDVKVRTKPELAREYARIERRRSSLLADSDIRILETLDVGGATGRGSGASSSSGSSRVFQLSPNFSSLQKRRRRPRPGLGRPSPHHSASILDHHYVGQAKCLLSTVGDWDFNVFNLDKLTNGRALFHMCLHLFQEHNLISTFQLDIVKLMQCLSQIEEGYHSSNPYHNAIHAADVTQAMHCYLREHQLGGSMTPMEKMCAILSAITHDLDHPGVNQAFLIATSNPLAALYQNTSVLENHHWRSAVGVIRESGVFDHFDQTSWSSLEWQIKSLILATDLTRQQEFLPKLKHHLDQGTLNTEDMEHRHFMLQIALKCADICNPCRTWNISRQWSEQVCVEFFRQGDYERKLGLQVSPLCDKYSTTVAKIQSGFMQFVVQPLFELWQRFSPSRLSASMLSHLATNKANWDRITLDAAAAAAEAEAAAAACSSLSSHSSEEEEMEHKCVRATVEPVPLLEMYEEEEEEKENAEPCGVVLDSRSPLTTVCEDTDVLPLLLPRRHSMPQTAPGDGDLLPISTIRRNSAPHVQSYKRRHSLPTPRIQASGSFDRLLDKLACLAECSPTSGSYIFEYEVDKPNLTSLSTSIDTGLLKGMSFSSHANVVDTTHEFDHALLAQRRFSEPPALAQKNLNLLNNGARKHTQVLSGGGGREPLSSCENGQRTFHTTSTVCPPSVTTTSSTQRTVSGAATSCCLQPGLTERRGSGDKRASNDNRRASYEGRRGSIEGRKGGSEGRRGSIEGRRGSGDNRRSSGDRRGSGGERRGNGDRRGSGGVIRVKLSKPPGCLSSDTDTQPLLSGEEDQAICPAGEEPDLLTATRSELPEAARAAVEDVTGCGGAAAGYTRPLLEEETPLLQDEPMRLTADNEQQLVSSSNPACHIDTTH